MSSAIEKIIAEEIINPRAWPYLTEDFFSFKSNPFEERLPSPRVFVGYEKDIRSITQAIRARTHVFVGGPVGVGKTTLVKVIHDVIREDSKDYRTFFVRITKSRYEKELAREILVQTGGSFRSSAGVAELYSGVMNHFSELHEKKIRVVGFIDDVVNAGDGTLRQIVYLIPDIYDYEPTLVFNGIATSMKEVEHKLPSLISRIGEKIWLPGLQDDEFPKLVNTRIRMGCSLSDWHNGKGCLRKQKGEAKCETCLGPFSAEIVKNLSSKVGASPRAAVNRLRLTIEHAANEKLDRVLPKYFESVTRDDFKKRIASLDGVHKDVIDFLTKNSENGDSSLTSISTNLSISPYTLKNVIEALMEQDIVQPKQVGESVFYYLTPQANASLLRGKGALIMSSLEEMTMLLGSEELARNVLAVKPFASWMDVKIMTYLAKKSGPVSTHDLVRDLHLNYDDARKSLNQLTERNYLIASTSPDGENTWRFVSRLSVTISLDAGGMNVTGRDNEKPKTEVQGPVESVKTSAGLGRLRLLEVLIGLDVVISLAILIAVLLK